MKIDKDSVVDVLRTLTVPGNGQDLISSGSLSNIQIFGDQIDIDLKINNPSLQARKKLEVEILKAIHSQINIKAKINTNIKVESAKPSLSAPIKGNLFLE